MNNETPKSENILLNMIYLTGRVLDALAKAFAPKPQDDINKDKFSRECFVKTINVISVNYGVYKGLSYVEGTMYIGYFTLVVDKFYLLKGLVLDEKKNDTITIIEETRKIIVTHNMLQVTKIEYIGSLGYYVEIIFGDNYKIAASYVNKHSITYTPDTIQINEQPCKIDVPLLKTIPTFNKSFKLPIETNLIKQAFLPMISNEEYYDLFALANEIISKSKNPNNLQPCIVCSDNKPIWCFDCGHLIYCADCYKTNNEKITLVCPLCMQLSTTIRKVFY